MKKELLQSFKIIILALVIGLGAMVVSAQLTPSSAQYPIPSNLAGPINSGSMNQIKEGDLTVESFLVSPIDTSAQFNGDVIFSKAGSSTQPNRNLCMDMEKKLKVCD